MKLLQNPWVTGSLVLVAAGIAAYQFLPSHPRALHPAARSPAPKPAPSQPRPAARQPTAPAPAPRPSAPAGLASSVRQAAPLESIHVVAEQPVDRPYVQANLSNWVNSPQRDPFLLLAGGRAAGGTNSPIAHWHLNAVWNQTGMRLAVINNHVYQEGDLVQGFKLLRISADEVWLRITNHDERLGFRRLGRNVRIVSSSHRAPLVSPPAEPANTNLELPRIHNAF